MAESGREYALETWTIHAGVDETDPTGTLVAPIYPSVGYARESLDQPREFMYSRRDNPTRSALEHVLARLHGAERAIAFGSGMAAVTAVGQLLPSGSHVLLPDDVYGNTHRLYTLILPEQKIEVDFVDYTDSAAVQRLLRPTTRLLWVETPTNPTQNLVDLAVIAEIGRAHGALVAVDNSWLSPYFQQPLRWGVDLVVESTTKYLNGHDDVLGGAVLTNDAALGERLAFLQYVAGAVPSPFDCWLLLRGLKTLEVRVRRQTETAQELARRLEAHPEVETVRYPGFGGLLSFDVADARKVETSTRLIKNATSLGGVESTMESRYRWEGDRVPEGLLRLSVGLEDAEALWGDLEQALSG